MIDPVMTLYNHVKRNPLHLGKSLATIARHREAGRFDPDLALRLLRNNVTDNVRAMPDDRFTIAHVSAVAVMLLADSAIRSYIAVRTRAAGTRITKREWARLGGLRNSQLYRSADSRGVWRYYIT